MTTKWLAAAALVAALAGCADETGAEPATVPVAPGVSSPAAPPGGPTETDQTDASDSAVLESAKNKEGAENTIPRGRTHAELERAQAGGVNAFVAAVRREFPVLLVDHRDEEIAAIAERACGSLAQGRASTDVVAQAATDAPGVDAATARRLVELAVKTVCPDLDRSLD